MALAGIGLFADLWRGSQLVLSPTAGGARAVRGCARSESAATTVAPATLPSVAEPDRSLWSAQRIRAYDTSSAATMPIGVLRIPAVKLAMPIYEGTSESTLNRGAGRIEGTAQLDEEGNVGIAAHRDGFFRALKDIHIGAELTLQTPRATVITRSRVS